MNNKKTENQFPDWWVKYKKDNHPKAANRYEDAKYALVLLWIIWVIIILYA
jgi:hypothetical protein